VVPDLNDSSLKHTVTWTIERLTASSIQIMFEMDGLQAVSVDSAANRIETFDELVVRGSLSEPLDFTIDNVRVEQIAVPEPTSLCLAVIACLTYGVWSVRRRRTSG